MACNLDSVRFPGQVVSKSLTARPALLPEPIYLDDHFFDEDEVLDYVWYEEMRQEDEGPEKPSSGCFGVLVLLFAPVAGLGPFLYCCL